MFQLQRAIIGPKTENSSGTHPVIAHSMGSHIVYILCYRSYVG